MSQKLTLANLSNKKKFIRKTKKRTLNNQFQKDQKPVTIAEKNKCPLQGVSTGMDEVHTNSVFLMLIQGVRIDWLN